MRKVYMDNGATSYPKAPGVGEAMADYILNVGCNIGRGGYQTAYDAAALALETREKLRALVNGPGARNMIFTPGSTHSLNYLIKGLLKPGDRVVTSPMEHNGVLRPLTQLQAQGVELDYLPCNDRGELLLQGAAEKLDGAAAVVLTHASNVCGTILPVGEVGALCAERGVPFLVDGSQSVGVIPVDMQAMHIDGLAFPCHKGLLGPQGLGVMAVTDTLAARLTPLVAGGTGSLSHELDMPPFLPDRFEAGTLNLPGILGLREGLLWLQETGLDRVREHELALTGRFLQGLAPLEAQGLLRVFDPRGLESRTGVVSLQVLTRELAQAAYELDARYGIMTRVGLHCAPSAHKTLGTFPTGTIRFSFGWWNTPGQVDAALEALEAICRQAP